MNNKNKANVVVNFEYGKLSDAVSKGVVKALDEKEKAKNTVREEQINTYLGKVKRVTRITWLDNLIWLFKVGFRIIFVREDEIKTDVMADELKRAFLTALLLGVQTAAFLFGLFCVAAPFLGTLTFFAANKWFSVVVGCVIVYISRLIRVLRIESQVMDNERVSNNLSALVAIISCFIAFFSLTLTIINSLKQ